MFSNLLLLLLFYFITYSETPPVGTTPRSVMGQKGENATLPCKFEARDIFDIHLSWKSKNIPVCQEKNCSVRVFKKGSCDIIIEDLTFSDAGKYTLIVYYRNATDGLKQIIRKYQLHIYDEIYVKTGEELKLDVLTNADKVEKNSSGEWTEVWTRGQGVKSDRLNDSDGNLTIKEFTVTDSGTYRVLDSKNETLITVTVTESSTGSDSKRINDDKTNGTEQPTVEPWIIGLSVIGALLVLALIIFAVIKIYHRVHGGYLQGHRVSGRQTVDSEESKGL